MEELWVFGYGSLMWRPNFKLDEALPAVVMGVHRSLCVYDFDFRGTPQKPGLVLGLDRGGACRGMAFRVVKGNEDATIAYLREREQITDVYREACRPVSLLDGSQREVSALCYLTDRSHRHYAGHLSIEEQLGLVQVAHGQFGTNIDYVLNTVRHLKEGGIYDASLMMLAARLEAGHN